MRCSLITNKQQAAAEAEENQKTQHYFRIRAGDTVCPFILKVIEMNPSQSPLPFLVAVLMEQHSLSHFSQWLSTIFEAQSRALSIKCNRNVKIAVFPPDIEFPESLHLELDLKTAPDQSKDILIVVPSHAFRRNSLKNSTTLKT